MPACAPISLRGLVEDAARTLAVAGVESPGLDAELLMAAALGIRRAQIVTGVDDLSADAVARYARLVARRAAREPLAYITGRKEFFSLELQVDQSVLIPRPETECVVEAAREFARRQPGCSVLDLGTGSGAIAIAVAANAPCGRMVATDISNASLEVARDNAARQGVADRIEFRVGDVWDALEPGSRFDLIVCNPPYIAGTALDTLAPEITRYEPRIALLGGADGLAFYRAIAARAREFLQPHGAIIVEVGGDQADAVGALLRLAGADRIDCITDLAGIRRVVAARF